MKENDFQRIKRIHRYCKGIESARARFGDNYEMFLCDGDYRDAVLMKILQIGELSIGLSKEFKGMTADKVEWVRVKGIRNAFVHEYEKVDMEIAWDTVINDIPKLAKFCEEICPSLSGGIEQ